MHDQTTNHLLAVNRKLRKQARMWRKAHNEIYFESRDCIKTPNRDVDHVLFEAGKRLGKKSQRAKILELQMTLEDLMVEYEVPASNYLKKLVHN